jgi:predicted nucleic acid-binding protein
VKVYVTEAQSEEVIEAVEAATEVVVSTLALAEVTHAITRREQNGEITPSNAQEAYKNLLEEWASLTRISLNDTVAREAAMPGRTRGLKGADAVQLATATLVSRERRNVKFLSYDEQLTKVARSIVNVYGE